MSDARTKMIDLLTENLTRRDQTPDLRYAARCAGVNFWTAESLAKGLDGSGKTPSEFRPEVEKAVDMFPLSLAANCSSEAMWIQDPHPSDAGGHALTVAEMGYIPSGEAVLAATEHLLSIVLTAAHRDGMEWLNVRPVVSQWGVSIGLDPWLPPGWKPATAERADNEEV